MPTTLRLLASKVSFLMRLSRPEAAKEVLQQALAIARNDKQLLRLRQQLGG